MCMMKGYHPYHQLIGMIRDSMVWEGLRCWLSWVRCEHEGLSPSFKDQFVILHYVYS
jgi:hypothetical protein